MKEEQASWVIFLLAVIAFFQLVQFIRLDWLRRLYNRLDRIPTPKE